MGMMLHRKSRRGNGILLRFGFLKTASFRRKMRSRRTKDCEKQGFGGNATNKQMHKRVPVCPACRYTMGQKKRKETDLFGEKSSFTLSKMGVNQQKRDCIDAVLCAILSYTIAAYGLLPKLLPKPLPKLNRFLHSA